MNVFTLYHKLFGRVTDISFPKAGKFVKIKRSKRNNCLQSSPVDKINFLITSGTVPGEDVVKMFV